MLGYPLQFGGGAILTSITFSVCRGLCTIAAFTGIPALISINLATMYLPLDVFRCYMSHKKRKVTCYWVELGSLLPRVAHMKALCANFSPQLAKNAKHILGKGTAP